MEHDVEMLLSHAIHAALSAGAEILDVYCQPDVEVEFKSDNSPLTMADRRAHSIISDCLKITNIPVLSEEGVNVPYAQRKMWNTLWIVDPLDGTKEFVSKNGEFCVNIALVKNHSPIAGVIYSPVSHTLWFGVVGVGAFKLEKASLTIDDFSFQSVKSAAMVLPLPKTGKSIGIVASRSHLNKETTDFIKGIQEKCGEVDVVNIGSALKFCLVADGKASVYPRYAPTCEWDTAAGHAIIKSIGGDVYQIDMKTPVVYNKENILNPWFIVVYPQSLVKEIFQS